MQNASTFAEASADRECRIPINGNNGNDNGLFGPAAVVLCLFFGGCGGKTHIGVPAPELIIQKAQPAPVPEQPPPAAPDPLEPPLEIPVEPKQPPLPSTILPPAEMKEPPLVRVWLSDLPANPEISCGGRLKIAAGGKITTLPRLLQTRATGVPGGIRLGEAIYPGTSLELQPDNEEQLRVNGRVYSGAIRLLRSGERLNVINALSLERYLLGVLGGEMPHYWPREALRAQAVAARSYALYYQLLRPAFDWDLTSTVEDQVYESGRIRASVLDAVNSTRGMVMLHEDGVFPAFFHSTCGGSTESPAQALNKPEYSFLRGVECGYCGNSKFYEWRAKISRSELVSRLKAAGIEVGPKLLSVKATVVPDGGRVVKMLWPGGETTVPIVDFRRAVGRMAVKSGRFECVLDNSQEVHFIFTGNGLGHGAGMCQYGCKGMAEAGFSWREILAHYYTEMKIAKVY